MEFKSTSAVPAIHTTLTSKAQQYKSAYVTGSNGRKIHVTKGEEEKECVGIELHTLSQDIVTVNGNVVEFVKVGTFKTSKDTFVASNGHTYTWSAPHELKDTTTNVVIAGFKNGTIQRFASDSTIPTPGVLQILPEGLSILDEIIATHIYTRAVKFNFREANTIPGEGISVPIIAYGISSSY